MIYNKCKSSSYRRQYLDGKSENKNLYGIDTAETFILTSSISSAKVSLKILARLISSCTSAPTFILNLHMDNYK